jgi:hypothetical protein
MMVKSVRKCKWAVIKSFHCRIWTMYGVLKVNRCFGRTCPLWNVGWF